MDRPDALLVVGTSVRPGHGHAPETESADGRAGLAEGGGGDRHTFHGAPAEPEVAGTDAPRDRQSLDVAAIARQCGGVDRTALADLLRSCCARLTPADVGLSAGTRRRTPGLRRDEVAALAAISTDYYTRLEQQRGPNPLPGVLTALARALRLSEDERD